MDANTLTSWITVNTYLPYCKHSKIQTKRFYHGVIPLNDANGIANSADPDQTAPLGAVWSGSALFAQTYLSENLGSLQYLEIVFFNFSHFVIFFLTTKLNDVHYNQWIRDVSSKTISPTDHFADCLFRLLTISPTDHFIHWPFRRKTSKIRQKISVKMLWKGSFVFAMASLIMLLKVKVE